MTVTKAVLPVGAVPLRAGVVSLVLLSPVVPLSLLPASWPSVVALVARVTVLLVSAPSLLRLAAASVNLSLATLMVALLAVLLGVKVAV